MKTTIILFFYFSFIGCSTLPTVGQRYNSGDAIIWVQEQGANCSIEYTGNALMLNDLCEKAKNELWNSERLREEALGLPHGGRITIYIEAKTIGAANTKYWEYVIRTFDDKEILREEGSDEIPEFKTSEFGTIWWNINVVDLQDKVSLPVKVFVINKLQNTRSEYIIYPDKGN